MLSLTEMRLAPVISYPVCELTDSEQMLMNSWAWCHISNIVFVPSVMPSKYNKFKRFHHHNGYFKELYSEGSARYYNKTWPINVAYKSQGCS